MAAQSAELGNIIERGRHVPITSRLHLPAPSNERDIDARRLGDLLDTLIAIRMDVGHNANGIAASPDLGPQQMSELRVLLDHAIAAAKEVFDSIHCVERKRGVASAISEIPMYVHQRTDVL